MDWQDQYSKNSHLVKSNLQIQSIPIKIPTLFFIELERAILKIIWNNKKLRILKNILNSKRTSGGMSVPDFRECYRAVVIKPVWNW